MKRSGRGAGGLGAALAALCAVVLTAAVAPASGAADSARAGAPKLLRLDYIDETESGGDRYDLIARIRQARQVTISTRFRGRTERADASREEPRSKTWSVGRDPAGRRVRKLVRKSLEARGAARVLVTARNLDGRARQWGHLDRKVCSREPQLGYNWTCVVRF